MSINSNEYILGIVIHDIQSKFFHSSKYWETFLAGYVCILSLSIITDKKYCIYTFLRKFTTPEGILDYTDNPPGSYGTERDMKATDVDKLPHVCSAHT